MRDAHTSLIRALQARSGEPATISETHSEAWASATFAGARHAITLRLLGDDADARAVAIADTIGTTEFDLPGHFVADIAVTAQHSTASGVTLTIEALTVEDA